MPPSFFFNGEELPKWTAQWCLCELLDDIRKEVGKWDEVYSFQDFWILYCRIDHEGIVESEDPKKFQISVLVFLKFLMANRDSIASRLRERMDKEEVEIVLSDLQEGARRMLALLQRDGICLWTSGNREDLARLKKKIDEYHDSPGTYLFPHQQKALQELDTRISFLVREVRSNDDPGADHGSIL